MNEICLPKQDMNVQYLTEGNTILEKKIFRPVIKMYLMLSK